MVFGIIMTNSIANFPLLTPVFTAIAFVFYAYVQCIRFHPIRYDEYWNEYNRVVNNNLSEQ
jgi:hypothetical protein